jgi:drug/metabolite transporter (DMT)-like permease
VSVATAQVGLAAVVMLVLTPAVGLGHPQLGGRVVAAVGALGVFGTGLAYVFNTTIVTVWGATSASTVTYLTPVVGVLLGLVVLSESATWNEPVGAVLVVAGIAITRLAPSAAQDRGAHPMTNPASTPAHSRSPRR